MANPSSPFAGKTSPIHLDAAPLVRVLCQVQWPEQTLLSTSFNQIADEIAVALAGAYPITATQPNMGFEFDPATGQVRQQALPPSRQFASIDDVWWVYFTPTFVTLENRGRYTTREDMTSRMLTILEAVGRSAQLPAAQRVGWRYINRVGNEMDVREIDKLVQPTVLGAGVIAAPDDVQLIHSLTESQFRSPDKGLQAKWGFLPANVVYDQNIPPIANASWILDLDAFQEARVEFVVPSIMAQIAELSSFAYTFFRWAVTDEFIKKFGGHE